MPYEYDYPRPALTVDVALFRVVELPKRRLEVLLVKRGQPPFKGKWALPGGFVNEGEALGDAAVRELNEETGSMWGGVTLRQIGTFGNPGRDPRGWTVSVAFAGLVGYDEGLEPRAGDDAAQARWRPYQDFNLGRYRHTLAFDHRLILLLAASRLRQLHPNLIGL